MRKMYSDRTRVSKSMDAYAISVIMLYANAGDVLALYDQFYM
jgi:hypothetical protein